MDRPLQSLSRTIAALQAAVAARLAHGMTGFLILRIWNQLSRIATAMPQAAARAGLPTRQRPPRPYVPRPVKPLAHSMEGWRLIRLPRREGWLIPLLPMMAASCGNEIRIMLAGPDMATLAATPRARRLLRPLCRMLGITDALPIPAPRNAAPGSFVATPSPAALAAVPRQSSAPPPDHRPDHRPDPWAACALPLQPALAYAHPTKIIGKI